MSNALASYFVVAVMLAGSLGMAGAADQMAICRSASGDEAIAACNRVIASGKAKWADRAAAFYNRGMEYYAKGDLDHVIADYDEAIRLDPKLAVADYDCRP